MSFYILLFVAITVPLVLVGCAVVGAMVGRYVGKHIASYRYYAFNSPTGWLLQGEMDWGSWIGSMFGLIVAIALILAFYFFGSIR